MGILFTQKMGHLHFRTRVWEFARGLFFVDGHILAQLGIWKVAAAAAATNKKGVDLNAALGTKRKNERQTFRGEKKYLNSIFRVVEASVMTLWSVFRVRFFHAEKD